MLALWTLLAAHAAPIATSTSADISTPGCGEPVVVGQLPAQGALVGTDVVPLMVFDGGNCGVWGWYQLDDGTSVVHESEAWADEFLQGNSVVRFPELPPLEPDTTYTLTYQPEGSEGIELSFTTGAGPMGDPNLPEGPTLTIEIDVVVPSGRRDLAVFAMATTEAVPDVLVRLSDSPDYTVATYVSEGAPRTTELGTSAPVDDPVACFYAQAEDAYGSRSGWTEWCDEVEATDDGTDDDDDEREPYTPKRCSTVSAGGAWGLMVGLVLAVGRRRR